MMVSSVPGLDKVTRVCTPRLSAHNSSFSSSTYANPAVDKVPTMQKVTLTMALAFA
jgi:hypothetical protein